MIAAHAWIAVLSSPVNTLPGTARLNSAGSSLALFLPVSMAMLTALLIFQEPLPGDRHFWMSRPYHWPKLLAAKILFAVVFINVPLFFSDVYILAAQGLTVLDVLPRLLLRQIHLTLLFILPSFAFAVITSSLAQFVLAWFLFLLAVLTQSLVIGSFNGSNPTSVDGLDPTLSILTAAACGVVFWQYATRRTKLARWVALVTACGFLPASMGISRMIPRSPVNWPQTKSAAQAGVGIAYDLERSSRRMWLRREWAFSQV